MANSKSKQDILSDISKKELGDHLSEYIEFFSYWYDCADEGCYSSDRYYDYFYEWLTDPIRNRDDKLDEILGINKNVTIGDYMNKKLDNN